MSAMDELQRRLPMGAASWLSAHDHDLAVGWGTCPRPEWLVHIALQVGVLRTPLVRATSDLVSTAVSSRHAPDLRPRRAVVTTLRWLAGRAPSSEAWAAGFAAMDAAETLEDELDAEAARAAACLAFACDDQADDGFYAHRAYAATAACHATEVLGDATIAADRFRDALPTTAILDAFGRLSQAPKATVRILTPIPPTPKPFFR